MGVANSTRFGVWAFILSECLFFTHTYNAIQFLLLILDEKSDGEKTTDKAGMADRGFLETIKLTVLQVRIKYYSCTK